ncbi:MAG: acetyl-CoA carboxylase biotin carboxyl carrier protein [Planctomycetia bacterium]|uniref:Biotin carboxyl carrier protein of acetyl-CoA carboxylase n=1 Tax=Candidatus Brocadia sapporoensis TaxID=392547 RepID=A0A1V6M1L3_9BACT|nr:acetyl-CoA carboxylase biotin carboxyl carrier protein [Candidatus Brocadia sapporoensis]MCC7240139.1 acetyl-CoA carboxylase biotin carboxyl carrier protein [Candidatus Brocadia sp.]QOJ06903.1 MAG: acetyl-CoA carboxylase biotin carboxyl carrier protein [Planctomycetia bacterium]TVL95788.1 MAG: acetyl-CoA carboxylase biotin carboxyl carrier protein [Candidatus Brocadia sp. BL1]MDG6004445.1 acetyl-CoA carboxylase biotin carboxyl carrier protein [Candidatus Brocadia sp.]OQD46304.1 acetyl-CoA c
MSIIDKVKQLISIMNENELSEIEIQEDVTKIRIKKTEVGFTHTVASPLTASSTYPQPLEQKHQMPVFVQESKNVAEVVSPMVGTFYRASAPGSEPCVNVGDFVNEETVVCIIEAMKIMNEVKAEMVGEVVDICVNDGEAVEFGQPLFCIRPSTK